MRMLDPKDYQKLFQIELSYLVSDLFAQHYKTLDCLLIADHGLWTSYIPKTIVSQTLDEGERLFRDAGLFKSFEEEFKNYSIESQKTLEQILNQDLTQESTTRFLTTISELWKFYSKTEFFYTDKVATITGDDILSSNLKALESIKNDGRSLMNTFIFIENNYLSRLLEKLSDKFNISTSDLKGYSIDEITNLFLGLKTDAATLSSRKEFFVMHSDGEKIIYEEGREMREKFLEFIKPEGGELKGVTANKGRVTGKVKVFPPSYYSDFSVLPKLFAEMEQGDILVAETTSPELIPACQKAGAILTNQGGLLSHAAIVSRELNIPCIVGMGNVVQTLKDGDIVEVNANEGIVRIIK